jgi:hypothetical protein
MQFKQFNIFFIFLLVAIFVLFCMKNMVKELATTTFHFLKKLGNCHPTWSLGYWPWFKGHDMQSKRHSHVVTIGCTITGKLQLLNFLQQNNKLLGMMDLS